MFPLATLVYSCDNLRKLIVPLFSIMFCDKIIDQYVSVGETSRNHVGENADGKFKEST